MIDIRKLKELVRLMVNNELTELDLRDSEEQVTLRRQSPAAPELAGSSAPLAVAPGTPVEAAAVPPTVAPLTAGEAESGLIEIQSPMVGTFYASSNPESEPFVSAGAQIHTDTVVCIVEAMKIFNEIKAECSGVIQRVLVQNGESVEFGQTLFLVKGQ